MFNLDLEAPGKGRLAVPSKVPRDDAPASPRVKLAEAGGGAGNEMWEEAFDTSRFLPQDLAPYPFDVSMFKYKMCVVGDAEVGKTSLMKCFQSTPMFFKSLPTVDCTVGINNITLPFERDGNKMQLLLQDFAGQEVYHGHSAFLTPRTMYVFVWNMSNVEQSFEHYGISDREEARLKYWLDEVQAKAPNSIIAIVGTHKDVLPDQNLKAIEIILQKVRRVFTDYIETLRTAKVPDALFICSTFSVSCKDRTCVSENRGGPSTIKDMFEFLAEVCYKAAARDRLFPATKIPSPIQHILRALQYIRESMNVIILPNHEFQRLLWQLQVTDKSQAENMTRLLHDWGVVYVFDRQASRLSQSDCVFLHPAQLSVMCAALFSYAHACMAPEHERNLLKGLTIDVRKCDAADPGRLILRGILIRFVAREIFMTQLKVLRRDPTSDVNVDICLRMLQDMDIAWRFDITAPCVTPSAKEEYAKVPQPMYIIPSLLPLSPKHFHVDIRTLLANRGVRRTFTLKPFPVEFFSNLVCRVSHMAVPLGLAGHRKDTVWIGGGGGADNAAVGIGPIRALVRWVKEASAIEVDAVQPTVVSGMTAQALVEGFTACLKELVEKCKGVTLTTVAPCPECGLVYNVDDVQQKMPPVPAKAAPTTVNTCPVCSPAALFLAGTTERTKESKKAIAAMLWGGRRTPTAWAAVPAETVATLEGAGHGANHWQVAAALGFVAESGGVDAGSPKAELRLSVLLDDIARFHFGIVAGGYERKSSLTK